MKILLLYETVYPDFIGGVEHRNHELGAALARRGHEVVLSGFRKTEPGATQVPVRSLGTLGTLYNASGQRSTRQAIRFAWTVPQVDVRGFDVVETANMPYIHIFPLALKCALAGKPLLVSWYEYWGDYWTGYVGRLKAPVYKAIEWLTGQLGTAATATSRLTQERLAGQRRRGGGVELVPCGIHVDEVRAAARVDEARHGQAPPLVYAGRVLREKRIDLLLRAVALLAPKHSGVLLTVFGAGPYLETLVRLASELGISDRVDFRGHVETNVEVWESLGRARIAVQPSEREGFGLFPLEAMAAGLPVVYCESPESAVPELVRHCVEGVCTPANPEALADALDRLMTDGEEWSRLRRNAIERASGYDWDEIARQIEMACARLIRRPSIP